MAGRCGETAIAVVVMWHPEARAFGGHRALGVLASRRGLPPPASAESGT